MLDEKSNCGNGKDGEFFFVQVKIIIIIIADVNGLNPGVTYVDEVRSSA